MLTIEIESFIKQSLEEKVQLKINSIVFSPVGGGSINDCYKLTVNSSRNFFIKINSAAKFPGLFEKEKMGLNFLAAQKIIRAPETIAFNIAGNQQLLILEWIYPGIKTSDFWKSFGEQLARLHCVHNDGFGFTEDNYMGALPQRNTLTPTWTDFFIQYRLQPQVERAVKNNLLNKTQPDRFEKLYHRLYSIFEEENPSLVHGDLWSGNFLCDEKSEVVLIDPAVYFGNRNMDLAMTTLFGGFDTMFYDSYNYHLSFPNNYREQWDICNLYPLLIHLNLFGSGYLHDIDSILKKFTR